MNVPARSTFAVAIDACVGIVRFRKGPEDVPAARSLLYAAILGSVLLRAAMMLIPVPESRGNPVVLMALDIGITLAALRLALQSAGKPERFVQTATAVFGCQVVMAPALFVGRWLMVRYGGRADAAAVPDLMLVPAMMVMLAIAVWVLAVMARILRSATEWPLVACVFVALAIDLVTLLIAASLYPPVPDAATAAPVVAPA